MKITPGETRIAWIGTGVMGASMCRRLMEAGFEATVTTRTRKKAEPLVELGASWADTPAAAAEQADVVFSIVGYPEDVREVHLGSDGTLSAMQPQKVLVDMTTSLPTLAEEIAEKAKQKQIAAIDAPVSGGDVGARGGTLSIMIGGDREATQQLAPCWDAMASTWVWQGEAGAGQHTKMVNQTLIGGNMIAVCEALLYATRAGLNVEEVLKSVSSGAAGSWALSNLAPRMIEGDFEPGFFVEHFLKDLGIVLQEARRMNLCLPGSALAQQLYQAVAAQGHAKSGTQALLLALAKLSAIDWEAARS